MWYKRAEAQKRFTLFYVATQLAGAFGGLLATAVSDLVRLIHPPFIIFKGMGPFPLHKTHRVAVEVS